MPLYEIVLRFPDRDEIRLTDHEGYRIGEEIHIAGRRFLVTGSERPAASRAESRLVLKPSDRPRAGEIEQTRRAG